MNKTVTCKDVIRELDRLFPENMAEEWDNPGLLAGHYDAEVRTIFVSLDASDEAVEEAAAAGADLIVTHHPLIFGGISKVNDRELTGRRIIRLIENHIACYAMHTNYDICRMADLNAEQLALSDREVLAVTGEAGGKEQGIGRVGTLPERMCLDDLAAYVKEKMELPDVIVYGRRDMMISRAAVSGGSGKSVVGAALAKNAQALITGDIDYHTACDAVAEGMCIIDAGHYGTEYCFVADVMKTLADLFPGCTVTGAAVRHPFHVV